MAGEHGGMDQGEPPEDYREFRRMMDAAGSEGLRRMIERLTEQVRANPHDTEALAARGLAYSELGNHRRAVEDNGSIIALDPDNADAHFEREPAPTPNWGSTVRQWRTTTPPSAWPPAMP